MVGVIRILAAFLVLGPTFAAAQSLADVAKAEEARRKTVNQPAKVYTNGDLRSDFTAPVTPAPAATAPAAGAAASGGSASPAPSDPTEPAKTPAAAQPETGARTEAYWKGRINEAKDSLNRSRMFADALQSRINALTTQVVNRDDPYQQAALQQDRLKNLAELERVKRDVDNYTKAIATIEEEARKAGAPPGWLR